MGWRPPKHHLARIFSFSCIISFTLYALYLFLSSSPRIANSLTRVVPPLSFLRPIADKLEGDARTPPRPHLNAAPKPQGWAAPLQESLLKRAETPSIPPLTIPITDILPSTLDLTPSSSILSTWDIAFNSLSTAAAELTRSAIKRGGLSSRVRGVPGTGITSQAEADALQAHLDCMSGRGEWVYDGEGKSWEKIGKAGLTVHKQEGVYATCEKRFFKGEHDEEGWDVRESLKWRWVPSTTCDDTAPSGVSPTNSLSRRRFCTLLAHKSTLIVGDTPQYSLHDLLLDWTSVVPQSCYGDLYCKEHALCGDILKAKADVEDWTTDERVYNRLPSPPNSPSSSRFDKRSDIDSPSQEATLDHSHTKRLLTIRAKSPSYGTLLRYRRSDGLRTSTIHTLPTYTHPSTGIREINQQWLADSRRSDLVILSKPPLPFPLRGHNTTFDDWWEETQALSSEEEKASHLIEAVWRLTEEVWLPELLDTLRAIRSSPSPSDQLIVYRSGWRSHPDCAVSSLPSSDLSSTWNWNSAGDGPPPHAFQPSLSKLLFRSQTTTSSKEGQQKQLINHHTLWFNLQTILQNYLVRTIALPEFGIPYLDLETMLSVWRSGMVGGGAGKAFEAMAFVDQSGGAGGGGGKGLRSGASGDCSRYCVPSPGSAIEEAFVGGLLRVSLPFDASSSEAREEFGLTLSLFSLSQIFERGWAGTSDRRDEWVGDGFINVRERSHT